MVVSGYRSGFQLPYGIPKTDCKIPASYLLKDENEPQKDYTVFREFFRGS